MRGAGLVYSFVYAGYVVLVTGSTPTPYTHSLS
jgi:hypothetical protein